MAPYTLHLAPPWIWVPFGTIPEVLWSAKFPVAPVNRDISTAARSRVTCGLVLRCLVPHRTYGTTGPVGGGRRGRQDGRADPDPMAWDQGGKGVNRTVPYTLPKSVSREHRPPHDHERGEPSHASAGLSTHVMPQPATPQHPPPTTPLHFASKLQHFKLPVLGACFG